MQLKQTVVVIGIGPEQLVPLEYGSCSMREDTPRNASGVADLRYRAQYNDWSATLQVRSIAGSFDIESLFALVDGVVELARAVGHLRQVMVDTQLQP